MLTEISHRRILCGLTSMWNLGGKNEDVELIEAEKKRERQGKTEERRKEKEKKWLSIGRDRKSAFCRLSVSR